MKIVRRSEASVAEDKKPRLDPWKVLIVDDEPDVRRVTVLNLRGFQFAGRGLNFLEASSAAEAKVILQDNDDLALALVDVVMETDDAGLKLVEYIRSTLENRMIRLIIRTGQPGVAPERYVIDNFDIDDYKDKSELTAQRLYTTVRTALKSYRDLLTIEASRIGLSRILNVTPDLYNLHRDRLEEYFQGVLMQTIGICNLVTAHVCFACFRTISGIISVLVASPYIDPDIGHRKTVFCAYDFYSLIEQHPGSVFPHILSEEDLVFRKVQRKWSCRFLRDEHTVGRQWTWGQYGCGGGHFSCHHRASPHQAKPS